jgi:hypothetical protein
MRRVTYFIEEHVRGRLLELSGLVAIGAREAPFDMPEEFDSSRVSGMPAQLTAANARPTRGCGMEGRGHVL